MVTSGREALDSAIARGSELLKQGKVDLAKLAFRSALDLDPNNMRVLALLGLAHFRNSELGEAQPIYEQLVERAPTDASHRLNLGLVYLKGGDAERAISALEASRALDPSQGRAVSYLGLAYARAGRYAEAYRAFLLAGQNELASEIEQNLTPAERDGIHHQLGRTPPHAAESSGGVPDKASSFEPRTKPPSAPPGSKLRLPTGDLPVIYEKDLEPESRLSSSMQFVMPAREPAAPQAEMDGHAITRAVAAATPAIVARPKTPAGGMAPQPLSELATEQLVRADEGDEAMEISESGSLVVRVTDRVLSRLAGVHVTGGDLQFEVATRRSRGHQTVEPFGEGATRLHTITGHGYFIAVPGDDTFTAVRLDDDILYLREDLVFAFEATLRWENGNVPGLRGKLPVVQFRGDGALALKLARPLVRVKLPANGVIFVDAERLAGWIGRVIPRAVVPPAGGPMGAMCVECTGEGVVLVEPAPTAAPVAAVAASPPTTPPPPPPDDDVAVVTDSPPQPSSAEIELDLLGDDDKF
ncbi:MAG TPA: tetratricopeptide repeat protein [Kofleriaceae bacterium]